MVHSKTKYKKMIFLNIFFSFLGISWEPNITIVISKDKIFTLFLIDENTTQKSFIGQRVSILEDCVSCGWLRRRCLNSSTKSNEIYLCNCLALWRWLLIGWNISQSFWHNINQVLFNGNCPNPFDIREN